MQCDTANNLLDDFLSGRIAVSDAQSLSDHLAECPACERNYHESKIVFDALRGMEVPDTPAYFADRVISKAVEANSKYKHRSMLFYVTSGIAASFALLFVLTFALVDSSKTLSSSPIVLIGEEIKTVKLAIESARTVDGIKMTIDLSENLEISGYEEMRNITWKTRLEKGTNVISLPISAIAQGDGKIKASVEFRDRKKVFIIDTRYKIPEKTGRIINTQVKA